MHRVFSISRKSRAVQAFMSLNKARVIEEVNKKYAHEPAEKRNKRAYMLAKYYWDHSCSSLSPCVDKELYSIKEE